VSTMPKARNRPDRNRPDRTRPDRNRPDRNRPSVALLVRRGLAFAFDGFTLHLPAAVLAAVVLAVVEQIAATAGRSLLGNDLDQVTVWSVSGFLVASALLEASMLWRWGTTPGRRLTGVRVIGTDGRRPQWSSALGYCGVRLTPTMLLAALFPFGLVVVVGAQLFSLYRSGLSLQERLSGLRVGQSDPARH
jgi:uncharacterized RDD family membrane protein YckC